MTKSPKPKRKGYRYKSVMLGRTVVSDSPPSGTDAGVAFEQIDLDKPAPPVPRCHTCKHWRVANDPGTFGICREPTGRVYVDEAMHMHVEKLRLTTDMMACSLWAARD